ncbi:MAG: transcriptional regulator, partial [Actinomycetota bacterium]|nr:transcriptional regulator [Actinomycetota bacterium]
LGVTLPRRGAIRYCVDWTEQRHHLAGATGRQLLNRLLEMDWVRRAPTHRAVSVTPDGQAGLARHFEISWPPNP